MNEFVWEFSRDRVRRLAMRGFRVYRRKPLEYRPIRIETDVGSHADGSAYVELGRTKVVAGVKFEVGQPYPDTPDKGALITDAELLPLASPTFEPGPPDENAIELARVVDRSIRESNAIDLSSLVIREGELVYLVFVDLRVLDADGNLFDASSLAAVSALEKAMDARFSVATVDDGSIVALQKGGEGAFTRGEVSRMLEYAVDLGKELRKKVKEAVSRGKD